MNDKPVVAHINKQYFAGSETFMYFYLSSFKRFHPVCLSWRRFIHTDQFPFPPSDCYTVGLNFASIRRLRLAFWKGLTGRLLPVEHVLRRFQVCLIHSHYGPVGWWSLPLRKALGIPLVTSFYGYDLSPELEEEGPAWPARRQQLFEQGDLFLVEGPVMRQRLIELGCAPDKVKIQRIALKLQDMPFRLRQPQRDGTVTLVFAGRFLEKKGLIYALQAVHRVLQEGRKVEFRIIGDGPLRSQIHSFVVENHLQSCVHLLGFLKHADYLREMREADIFLHPSVEASDGDTEGGAPTTILEAQALGMPVLSTFHADIPNVVMQGKSARLVPERDSEALSEALLDLVDHPKTWAEMGQAGRQHVEAYHDVNREIAALEGKYRDILQGRGEG